MITCPTSVEMELFPLLLLLLLRLFLLELLSLLAMKLGIEADLWRPLRPFFAAVAGGFNMVAGVVVETAMGTVDDKDGVDGVGVKDTSSTEEEVADVDFDMPLLGVVVVRV